MKFEILKFKSVTSTNDIAINLIKERKNISGCILADIQTKGRGTHGKKWISEKGNLFITIFFPLEKKYPPFNEFTKINPIIIYNVIKKFCNKNGISLKFPNDVFVKGKKICGLLQEVVTLDEKKFLVIGIGLNIISSPDIDNKYQTTNMFTETGKKPPIEQIIALIISSYENFFKNLNTYDYENYKKKAESLSLNQII